MTDLKLVTKREQTADLIVERLREITVLAEQDPCVGLAVVILRGDGSSTNTTVGSNNRVLLLGAVSDLQYSLAAQGDR